MLDAPALTGTVGATPPTQGQTADLVARVQPKTATAPTGSVTFKDGATVLGSAALDASGMARLAATLPSAGLRSLTATYTPASTAFKGKRLANPSMKSCANLSMLRTPQPLTAMT